MANTRNIEILERETIKGYFMFYNELADKYPEAEIVYSTEEGRNRKNYLIKILKKNPNLLTLDLGCNNGHYKPYINRYVGLDIASSCLSKFKAPRLQALAQQLPFRKNTFERIFASEVLEHIWNRKKVLSECRRILKPNSEIILSVPYGKNPYGMRPRSGTKRHKKYGVNYIPYIHGKFSKEDVTFLLENNGFYVNNVDQIGKCNIVAVGIK